LKKKNKTDKVIFLGGYMHLTRLQQLSYEYPECEYGWECKECSRQRRELEDNEEAFDRIRDNLEKVIELLSSKDDLNLNALNLSLASMSVELGVEFNLANVQRLKSQQGVYYRS
jgi:hypothetical protein